MNTAKQGGGEGDLGVGPGGKAIREIVVSSRRRRPSSPSIASTYNILNTLFSNVLNTLFSASLAFFSELSSFRKPP